MAGFGDVLRGLGSVLNPQVMQSVEQEDQRAQALNNQLGLLLLQNKLAQNTPEALARLAEIKRREEFRARFAAATTDEERRQIAREFALPGEVLREQPPRPLVVAPGSSVLPPGATTPSYTAPDRPQRPVVATPGSTVLNPTTFQPEYEAPDRAPKNDGAWSEPYQLGGATVQRNSVTGEIRTAVTRPPVIHVRTEKPDTSSMEALYKDYANHPQVKEANDLEAKMQPLVDYMISFQKTGKSVNAADAALAKAYLATTTSLGNRAYTMDKKELSALPNLGDRLGNMASSFFAGKDLTDQTRAEMFNYIKDRYKALDSARTAQKAMTARRGAARGITPAQIFGEE